MEDYTTLRLAKDKPQWSLTFEVRKSGANRHGEGSNSQPQWSLTFEVRKRRGGHR